MIQVSVDHYSHNGWSMDHQGLPPVDLFLLCEPEPAVALLNPLVKSRPQLETSRRATPAAAPAPADLDPRVRRIVTSAQRSLAEADRLLDASASAGARLRDVKRDPKTEKPGTSGQGTP